MSQRVIEEGTLIGVHVHTHIHIEKLLSGYISCMHQPLHFCHQQFCFWNTDLSLASIMSISLKAPYLVSLTLPLFTFKGCLYSSRECCSPHSNCTQYGISNFTYPIILAALPEGGKEGGKEGRMSGQINRRTDGWKDRQKEIYRYFFPKARNQKFLVECPLANIKSLCQTSIILPVKLSLPLDLKLHKHLFTVKTIKSFTMTPYLPTYHNMSFQILSQTTYKLNTSKINIPSLSSFPLSHFYHLICQTAFRTKPEFIL